MRRLTYWQAIGLALALVLSFTNALTGKAAPVLTDREIASGPSPNQMGGDALSLVQWFTRLIAEKDAYKITQVIGSHGVRFYPYAVGGEFLDRNNGSEFAAILNTSLKTATPRCIGYNVTENGMPDKVSVLYRGIDFPKSEFLGPIKGTVVGFAFFKMESGWELVYISPIPDDMMDSAQPLRVCPATSIKAPSVSLTPTPQKKTAASTSQKCTRQVTVRADRQRTSTGCTAGVGKRVTLTYVSGQWRTAPQWRWDRPNGELLDASQTPGSNGNPDFPVPGLNIMALVAWTGTGQPFIVGTHLSNVGDRYTFTSNTAGLVQLRPNDDNVTDNEGSIVIRVEVE